MPRINNPKPPKRAPKIDNRRTKKKPCSFCQHGVVTVDYKDLAQLRKYISDRGKIRGRKVSGNCQQHQRDVTDSIKTARELGVALLRARRDFLQIAPRIRHGAAAYEAPDVPIERAELSLYRQERLGIRHRRVHL